MESNVNYTWVGLFVVVLSAALLAAALWLLLGGDANKRYQRYVVYTGESVAGLSPKSLVRYRGVEVGLVESVELDRTNPEQVAIVLQIEPSTPVRANTQAILVTQGLTGLTTVELTGGTSEAPPLTARPGDLPVIASGPSLIARLDDAFTSLSAKLDRLLADDNQTAVSSILADLDAAAAALTTLLDQDNQRTIERLLTDAGAIVEVVAARADALGQGLESAALTLANSAAVSTELTPMLARFNQSLAKIEEAATTITRTSRNLDQAVQESRRELLQITTETTPEITALIAELRQFTAGLQRLGRELERDPRALLFGRQRGAPGPGE